MRVAQTDRDRTVDELRDHAGDGRLDVSELEQRVETALAATTYGELHKLTADLPRRRHREQRSRPRPSGLLPGLAPLLAAIAVLVLAPPAVAWVGWVVLGIWFFGGKHAGLLRLPRAG
jgi:hypothetical protein